MLNNQSQSLPAYEQDTACPAQGFPARDERTVTLFMIGRLWHRGSDIICRIRNISPGGMRIETGMQLQLAEKVSLETRSGSCLDGQVVWSDGAEAGIQFAKIVEHEALFAAPAGLAGELLPVRGPRFPTAVSATVRVGGRAFKARVVNVSLSGCAVQTPTLPPRDSLGEVTIAGLPPLQFASRWTQDGLAGLAFLEKLGFADLAEWLCKPEQRFKLGSPE